MKLRRLPLPARLGALAAVGVLALGGCAAGADDEVALLADIESGASAQSQDAAENALVVEQIYALDVDETAGVVRLATSNGVLVAPLPLPPASEDDEDGDGDDRGEVAALRQSVLGDVTLLGDRMDDVMGYLRLGQRILISGHFVAEGGEEDNLGVWEADEADGEWRPVALEGDVDFHTIVAAGPAPADAVVAAIDALSNQLYYSPDAGLSWQTGATVSARSLAFTAGGSALIAATPVGVFASTDRGGSFTAVDDAPALQLLATPPVGSREWRIVGIDSSSTLWQSTDGLEWSEIGTVPVFPDALALSKDPEAIYIATTGGVSVTRDEGETFTQVVSLTP